VIVSNSQRQELKKLKEFRKDLEQRLTKMVESYAKPEERTMNIQGEHFRPTQKIVPTLIRRNSFSESFL
jgi:hypothetical protein